MEGDPSLLGGIAWALRTISDITFRWVPATVEVVSGTAPDTGTPPPMLVPVTQPVTAGDVASFLQTAAAPGAYDQLYHNWSILVVFSILLSLLLAAGCIYCILRIFQIRHNEEQKFKASAHPVASKDVSRAQLRWNRILEQSRSDSDQAGRLAILEADIMLNELLDVLGYRGDTMADKMKQINRTHFKSIDLAWEAHLVRNATRSRTKAR